METWKPIVGFEGLYAVSDRGRVKSLPAVIRSSSRNGGSRYRHGKILKQKLLRKGYKNVQLCKDGAARDYLVHRLVAQAFLPPEPGKDFVNHKNLHKDDNRVENLEWCNRSENQTHALQMGAYHRFIGYESRKPILCVELNRIFESSYQAAEYVNGRDFSFSKDTSSMSRKIRACAIGTQHTAYGYRWKDVPKQPSTTIPKGSTHKCVETGDPS